MKGIGTAVARVLALQIFTVGCLLNHPAAAQQRPTSEVLEYKGTVAASQEAEVAPRLDGLLTKINFTAGQHVKKGPRGVGQASMAAVAGASDYGW